MKRTNKKIKYSAMEKRAYHTLRCKNKNVSARKQAYSRGWLDGFEDKHSKVNLIAVQHELSTRRKNKVKFNAYDCSLLGYKNGLVTSIKTSKK